MEAGKLMLLPVVVLIWMGIIASAAQDAAVALGWYSYPTNICDYDQDCGR